MTKEKPIIYLAGPLGFSEIGRLGIEKFIEILSSKFEIINPFTLGSSTEPVGRMNEILQLINSEIEPIKYRKYIEELQEINFKIGQNNKEAILKSDFVFAILDGSDVDSGTAAEIGFAFGVGKRIYGYRNDFRLAGDNLGSQINLQVEYFIKASKGNIFTSYDEIEQNIDELLN